MKFSLLLLCGLTTVLAVPYFQDQDARLEDPIVDIINKTLNAIIQNISEPLTPKDVHLTFNHDGILTGFLNSSDILINGLKKTYASVIKVDEEIKMAEITLNVHDLVGNFEYIIDAVAMDLVPLYGAGNIKTLLRKAKLHREIGENHANIFGSAFFRWGYCRLDFFNRNLYRVIVRNLVIDMRVPTSLDDFKNATFLLHVGSTVFNTQGILNNPEFSALLNTALNDNFAIFVNHNNKVISKLIVFIIQKIYGKEVYTDDDYLALDFKDFVL